jgi:NAD+ synthase
MALELACRMGMVEHMIRYEYWNSGAKGIVIGLSGGVDSAVAAAFCCRAVGAKNVLGIFMPSSVSRREDGEDVSEFCNTFGISCRVVSIEPMLGGFADLPGYGESRFLSGNLMARIRMAILYYHANAENRLVCGTSNRSEFMLGYCTKFGDNAADFQPIVHLYKTEIYDVARAMGVTEAIIKKPPSAGLWEGQTDEKELGLSYDEIDSALMNLEKSGWKPATPAEEKVLALVKKSAHKRQPAPNLLAAQQEPCDTLPDNSGT